MKSVFVSGTAMPSKKCYHSSSESWHMICRRNPPTPCLAPRCFSTIIVRNHLLLATAILPVSSRCLTPCALAVLASVIILTLFFLHLHLPAQHSSTLNMLTKSRLAISCRPQCWLTAQCLCLSASRSCTFSRWRGFTSICATRHSLISLFHIFLTNFDCLAYKPRGI